MRPVVWECDGCEVRSEDGMPGCPPEGWLTIDRVRLIGTDLQPLDLDLCPTCARGHDLVELVMQLGRPYRPPLAKKQKQKEADPGEEQEELWDSD